MNANVKIIAGRFELIFRNISDLNFNIVKKKWWKHVIKKWMEILRWNVTTEDVRMEQKLSRAKQTDLNKLG
jgi:hypothetical protein